VGPVGEPEHEQGALEHREPGRDQRVDRAVAGRGGEHRGDRKRDQQVAQDALVRGDADRQGGQDHQERVEGVRRAAVAHADRGQHEHRDRHPDPGLVDRGADGQPDVDRRDRVLHDDAPTAFLRVLVRQPVAALPATERHEAEPPGGQEEQRPAGADQAEQ
jgi:hypothetical protein